LLAWFFLSRYFILSCVATHALQKSPPQDGELADAPELSGRRITRQVHSRLQQRLQQQGLQRPGADVAATAAEANRAEVRAAVAGSSTAPPASEDGKEADSALLKAVQDAMAEVRADARGPALDSARKEAVKAGAQKVWGSENKGVQAAAAAAKSVKQGQMSAWLLPSASSMLRGMYDASSAASGDQLVTLLQRDVQLAAEFTKLEAREAKQAAELQQALRLTQPLRPSSARSG